MAFFGPTTDTFYVLATYMVTAIVFVSKQEKCAKEQWDKLLVEKAFVRTKESVLRQNKDYVGGATCWSSSSVIAPWSLVLNKPARPEAFYQFITLQFNFTLFFLCCCQTVCQTIHLSPSNHQSLQKRMVDSGTETLNILIKCIVP